MCAWLSAYPNTLGRKRCSCGNKHDGVSRRLKKDTDKITHLTQDMHASTLLALSRVTIVRREEGKSIGDGTIWQMTNHLPIERCPIPHLYIYQVRVLANTSSI